MDTAMNCPTCDHFAHGWCTVIPEKTLNAGLLASCPRGADHIRLKAMDDTPPPVQIRGRYEITELPGGLYEVRSRNGKGSPRFNRQKTDSIAWSSWSWNPISGCLHNCAYCYAFNLAESFPDTYPTGFSPTLWPDRLEAPKNTPLPKNEDDRRCFVCSMADIAGRWVPDEWIAKVMDACREARGWTYIFLTKNPELLPSIDFPEGSWVGATVDIQSRVEPSISSLLQVTASKRFLSCEPILEPITFPAGALENIDLIILGAQSRTDRQPEFQPEQAWVDSLARQTKETGTELFLKANLKVKPRDVGEAV